MRQGPVAELVDALDSKSSSARSVGSSPTRATRIKIPFWGIFILVWADEEPTGSGRQLAKTSLAQFKPYVAKGAHGVKTNMGIKQSG